MSVIEHSRPCEDRLLGYVARHYPVGTFTLQNLEDGARHVRDSQLAPTCECGRIQLAKLNDLIGHTRALADPEGQLAGLLRQRIALRAELADAEEQRRGLQQVDNELQPTTTARRTDMELTWN